MERDALFAQVRVGMQVQTSDGKRLGRLRQVHQRETDGYIEVEAAGAFGLKRLFLFLPPETVDTVAEKRVTLNVDAKMAKGYNSRPRWIPEEIGPPIVG